MSDTSHFELSNIVSPSTYPRCETYPTPLRGAVAEELALLSSPTSKADFNTLTISDNVSALDSLLQCAKDVPNVAILVQSARISLRVIGPLRQATPSSNYPVVVTTVREMRITAEKFVNTLGMTIRNAGYGFAIANNTIALCEFLNAYTVNDVLEFIGEIRPMAQQAYHDTIDMCQMFESVRLEFLKIQRRLQSELMQLERCDNLVLLPYGGGAGETYVHFPQKNGKKKDGQDRRMEPYSVTAMIDLLRQTNEDLSTLITCISDSACWCSKTDDMLLSLMSKVGQSNCLCLDPERVEAARKFWAEIGEEYLHYKTSIIALKDFYSPLYDFSTHKNNAPQVLSQVFSSLTTHVLLRKNRDLGLPNTSQCVPADRREDWKRTKARVITVATSILGTTADVGHEALSFSAHVLPYVPVAGLAQAANLLLAIWDSLQLVERNDSDCLHIAERCADILFSVRIEIEKAGKEIENEIRDCFMKLTLSFRTVENCFRKYGRRPFHKRYFERDQISRDIAACNASLNEFLLIFSLSIQLHILRRQARHQAETAHQLAEVSSFLNDNKNLLQSISLFFADVPHPCRSLHAHQEIGEVPV